MTSPSDLAPSLNFPIVDGARSTSATGQGIVADAARAVDADLAAAVEGEQAWRRRYEAHFRRLVEAGTRSPEAAVTIATAGLASAYRRLVVGEGAASVSLEQAVAQPRPGRRSFDTVEVSGQGKHPRALFLPHQGAVLAGPRLERQLWAWVAAGICEPSAARAVELVMENPDWLDLRDLSVAVVGAASEMGPLRQLSTWGATVLAVDLPRPALWRRVLETVRKGSGRALVPLRSPLPRGGERSDGEIVDRVGADLLTEWDSLADWLADAPSQLTVGCYVYANGGRHVRVTMAADAMVRRLQARRDDLSLAFLLTPTDVFAVPPEAVAESRRRYAALGWRGQLAWPARTVSRGSLFQPSYLDTVVAADGTEFGIADCVINEQGPNYLLAKRLQRWRATVAREGGQTVSANVGPSTRTRSVLKNRAFAAAYAGSRWFGMEVFDPQTSNALMAALLVHDLRNPQSSAHPGGPLANPQELFMHEAVHGGMWRSPFAPRSVLGPAALLGAVEFGR